MRTESLGLLALALLAACAPRVDSWKTSGGEEGQTGRRGVPRSWDARVGVFTFSDALSELGEPVAIDSTPAGVVATWEKVPRARACLGICAAGLGGAADGFERSNQRRNGVYIERERDAPVAVRKDSLTLVFDADRVLVAWSRR